MKKDKYGFTIASFAKKIPIGPESFAVPMHIDQVFCSPDPQKEVRSRRVEAHIDQEADEGFLSVGADNDFSGLRAPENIDKTIPFHGPSGGRTISLATILVEEQNIGVVGEREDEVLLVQSSDDEAS